MSEDDRAVRKVPTGADRSQPLSRRRLLALAGTGIVGSIAGCSGDGSGDGTDSPTDAPTDTATASPTATTTPTATPTATPEPTERPPLDEALGEWQCPDLEADPDIVVAQDGSGDYETVEAAIEAIPEREFSGTLVHIKAGRYKEKLYLPREKARVTFVGDGPGETVLTYDDHVNKTGPRGRELGVDRSASFQARGVDFTAANLTFENAAEPVAQAIALLIDSNRTAFFNCEFLGNQDTLYTLSGRAYFEDCYVEGDVDFIFGAASTYFENCEIFCKEDGGYVTAADTPEYVDYGFVFNNCEVTADAATDDSYYLGRPWGPSADTVFMNTHLGDHVHPDGWSGWDGREDEGKVFYAEYDNGGPGYVPEERVDWSTQLSDAEAEEYADVSNVLRGWDPSGCQS